jgi:hypothetical protein
MKSHPRTYIPPRLRQLFRARSTDTSAKNRKWPSNGRPKLKATKIQSNILAIRVQGLKISRIGVFNLDGLREICKISGTRPPLRRRPGVMTHLRVGAAVADQLMTDRERRLDSPRPTSVVVEGHGPGRQSLQVVFDTASKRCERPRLRRSIFWPYDSAILFTRLAFNTSGNPCAPPSVPP